MDRPVGSLATVTYAGVHCTRPPCCLQDRLVRYFGVLYADVRHGSCIRLHTPRFGTALLDVVDRYMLARQIVGTHSPSAVWRGPDPTPNLPSKLEELFLDRPRSFRR